MDIAISKNLFEITVTNTLGTEVFAFKKIRNSCARKGYKNFHDGDFSFFFKCFKIINVENRGYEHCPRGFLFYDFHHLRFQELKKKFNYMFQEY